MKLDISLHGLERTVRGFHNLTERAQFRIIRNASRAGASTVRSALKKNAPRDSGGEHSAASRQYGTLRRNVKLEQLRGGRRSLPYYLVTTGDAFWGRFLDTGAGRYNVDPGPRSKGARARTHILPTYWFRRTVEQIRPQVTRAMIENIRRSIVREFAKIR